MRLHRRLLAVTRRDMTIQSWTGPYLYGTSGDFLTLHSHTHIYEASSGHRLAFISRSWPSQRKSYEITSFIPVCPTQNATESDEGGPLYPFARFTKLLLTVYSKWVLELYNCDGSLAEQLLVRTRRYVSWKYNYDVLQKASGLVIGTIDQTYYASISPYHDMWILAGQDRVLFSVIGCILDIQHHLDEVPIISRSNSSGSSGGSSGGSQKR